MKGIPEILYPFFWEYDPSTIDVDLHAHVIMGRIMARGSWEAMHWLRKKYSTEQLSEFINKKGARLLPPRELNYWALLCNIPAEARQKLVHTARTNQAAWTNRNAH